MGTISALVAAVWGAPLWPASNFVSMLTNVISLFAAVVVVIAGVIGLIWWWTSSDIYRSHR